MEKRCPRCSAVKTYADFRRNKANKDGRHTYCRPCHTERMRERKPIGSGRRITMRAYYETPAGRASYLRSAAKQRAGGEIFTSRWLAEKIAGGKCEVTGLPFDMGRREGAGQNPMGPSIDRIDPSKGYTQDNVQVVIFAFNAFKSRMTQDEAVALLKRMAANL